VASGETYRILTRLFGATGTLAGMTNRTKTMTAALGGAVALASAAYAIGSQVGDGAATAAPSASSAHRSAAVADGPFGARMAHLRGGPRGDGLSDLADDLGVSEAKLREALEAVREDLAPKGDPREEHAAALAKALGKSADEVEQAFEKVRDQREAEFAATLARSLNLDAAKVRAALEAVRPDDEDEHRRGGPRAAFGDLADELGVSEARLRRALREARPSFRGRDRGEAGADLAKALGVTTEQLRSAFEQLREDHEAEHERRRAAFVTALAKELGISEDKVRDALPERGPFGGRGFHRRGPR
jgi:Clp amino terminal domain, pathogenicity island component